jgi:hypothetical protein
MHIILNGSGAKIPVSRVIAELEPTTGKVMAQWNYNQSAALIQNQYGKGRTYLFGTLLGCAFDKEQVQGEHTLMSLMTELLKSNKEKQAFRLQQVSKVTMRYLEGEDYHICGVFNFSAARQTVLLDSCVLNEKSRIENLFGIKVAIVNGKVSINLPGRSISIFKVF